MGRLAPAEYVCRVGNYNKLRDVISTCERPRRRILRLQHNLTTHSDRPSQRISLNVSLSVTLSLFQHKYIYRYSFLHASNVHIVYLLTKELSYNT